MYLHCWVNHNVVLQHNITVTAPRRRLIHTCLERGIHSREVSLCAQLFAHELEQALMPGTPAWALDVQRGHTCTRDADQLPEPMSRDAGPVCAISRRAGWLEAG